MGRHIKQKRKQTEGNIYKSRKELRKEQRRRKKAKRKEFFQRKKSNSKKFATGNTDNEEQTCNSTDMSVSKQQEKQIRRKYNEMKRNQKLQMSRKNQLIKQLKKANEKEDRVIKKLEKQLKLSKRKLRSVPKSFAADGLDCILVQRCLCFIFIQKPQIYPHLNYFHIRVCVSHGTALSNSVALSPRANYTD
jgi:hypothetical protein